jgi:3-oxoacyl-[acyl-carrier protein] reductase
VLPEVVRKNKEPTLDLSLSGRNALVCGGSRGIGRAVAMELAALGAQVHLLARNRDSLEAVLSELPRHSDQTHTFVAADHSDPHALIAVLRSHLSRFPPVTILVNNTGGPPGGPITEAEDQHFLDAFSAHLLCNHLITTLLLDGMKREGYGRIINVISTSVKEPLKGLGVSNTIRGAVASWAKTLATEVAPHGITVNNVLPGATATDRLSSLVSTRATRSGRSESEVTREIEEEIPMKRIAHPSEVAHAVAFLASPAASYITGVNLPVDGGRTHSL